MDSEDDIISEEGIAQEAVATGDPATAGEALRVAREERRLSLDHIAAETRIPIRHLKTIEQGNFEELPSRTYAIGFARTFAGAVGLDGNKIADMVRAEMGDASPRYSTVGQGMEPGDPAKVPAIGLAWFGGIAALILAVGVVAFASSYFGAGEELGSLLDELQSEETAPSVRNETDSQDDAGDAQPTLNSDGQVVFTALEDGVWVRFYEQNGERLFEAQMASGDTFDVPKTADEPRINTGRPDAFVITINGREVPKLAEEPITISDTPISAAALLARAEGD